MLRPVLRGGTAIAADISAPLRRPVLPYLAEFVVVDQPDTMTYVSAEQLAIWQVDAEEVFTAARRNLSGAVLRGVAHEPTVVRFVDDGDAYWTSHLLIDGWLGRLAEQVGGVPVAFAPERGTLLVTAEASEHLPRLFAQVEAVYACSPRAISPMAYVSDADGRTAPYAAPEGHPLRECVRRAEAVLAATEYARQAATLAGDRAQQPTDPADKPTGLADEPTDPANDPTEPADKPADPANKPIGHPAALVVAGSGVEGWRTRALWPRNEPALLPLADEVLLGDRLLTWEKLEPHLAAVPGLDPPRWRAIAWPP
jgi:hypothetical protein